MEFWKLSYERGWIADTKEESSQKLRIVVRTKENPHGDITPEEYKEITGINF